MGQFRKPRSLFFPLLLIFIGVLIFLINTGRVEGTAWDNLLKFWPILLIVGGIDGLYRHDGWVGPLVVLGLGTILLLGNFDILAQDGFILLLRLWPIILVAIGLDILFSHRRSIWNVLLRIALGLALVGGILWLAMTSPNANSVRFVPFEQSLDAATSSDLSLKVALGKVSLEDGAEASQLISGTVGVPQNNDLSVDYKKPTAGNSKLTLEGNSVSFAPITAGAYPWTLKLNSSIPVTLSVEQAVGVQELNLENLRVTEFHTELAVGTATITLPENTDVSGKIECAVGQVIVRIPRGSNVVINTDTAVVPVSIPQNYRRSNDRIEYLAGSGNKITLEIDIAVGNLVIEEY